MLVEYTVYGNEKGQRRHRKFKSLTANGRYGWGNVFEKSKAGGAGRGQITENLRYSIQQYAQAFATQCF